MVRMPILSAGVWFLVVILIGILSVIERLSIFSCGRKIYLSSWLLESRLCLDFISSKPATGHFLSAAVINSPFSSVQFSHPVVSSSLRPHESQHARPPCPSPSPRVNSNSCPSSQWCHPAISSLVVPFSSCPQPLPASEYFPMSQLFATKL